jgi:WD40 repeat protein/tRNA A-37 threonylcarbamoyl transferase component Bud32
MSDPSKHSQGDSHSRPEIFDEVLAEYLRAIESGGNPSRDDLLARYPELASELREFFANHDRMGRLARPLREPTAVARSRVPGEKIRYFGDYEVLEEIGHGGMGVIYKARQVSLNRVVALKMILAGRLANEQEIQRFHSEAEAAAKLEHPGIVPIFEIGQHAGQHYFSMGFVDGESLAKTVAAGPLTPRRAAELVAQIAETVHYAHERGIIHRDLKPANVLLDQSGQPHVTDFGLAKKLRGDSDLTGTGQILGTPSYMPPEQAAGNSDPIGPAADVYALGAILYCLLTGRPPFQAATPVDTLRQVLEQEPVSVHQLNGQVPLDLETIALKCLEKDPRRRYATAAELAEELERYLDGRPILARPVGFVDRTGRWCRRNPVVAALITTAALCLFVGTVASSYFAVEASKRATSEAIERGRADDKAAEALREKTAAEKQKQIADQRTKEAIAERERADTKTAEAISEKQRADATALHERIARAEADANAERARRLLYVANMNLAQQSWKEANVRRVLELLKQQEPSARKQDLRGWEWHYLWKLCHSDLRTLKGHTGRVNSVAFSPDGKRIASGCSDQTIRLWDAESGIELAKLKAAAAVSSVAFSPDGKRIAAGYWDQTVKLWDVESGAELATLRGPGRMSFKVGVAFSPDGKRIASGGEDNTIKLWDAERGTELATLKAQIEKGHATIINGVAISVVWSIAFSPDGKRIASGGDDRTIKLWDVESGAKRATLKGAGVAYGIAFSPDGKRLASASGDGTIKLWDAESGAERATLKGAAYVGSIAFSPDGKRIAGSDDQTVKLWDAESGAERATLKGHVGAVTSIAFSPDGKRLASASDDQTIKQWDAESGGERATLKELTGGAWSVTFSRDGKRIASASEGNTIKLWDAESGVELATLKVHTSEVVSTAFSPDGKRIASGCYDNTIKLWDAESGAERATLKGHTSEVAGVAFSPDGKRLASGSGDGTIKLWDAASAAELATLKGAGYVSSIAFSPDGKRITSVNSNQTIKLWDAERKAELATLKVADFVTCIAFSLDGKRITSGGEMKTTVKLWDAERGTELATLKGHARPVNSVAFSPDGTRIASGSEDQTIKLWDATTGVELATLKGHVGRVRSVAFSPDGKRIASGSDDQTIKLWDAELGMELAALTRHGHRVESVAFSPNGKGLVASGGRSLWLYDATILNEDEKMARFHVDHFFKEMGSIGGVVAAIQRAGGWNQAMRDAALSYARSRAPIRPVSSADAKQP